MKSKGMKLGAMFTIMLIVSMVFVPAVSAQEVKEQKDTKVLFTPIPSPHLLLK